MVSSFFHSLPRVIKNTLFLTFSLTAVSFFLEPFLVKIFHKPLIQMIFSLNLWGIQHGCIWQLFSYLFLLPLTGNLSIGSLFYWIVQLYLLAKCGTDIVSFRGSKSFLEIYFGGGVVIALVTSLLLILFSLPLVLSGPTYAIYLLLFSWCFLFPDATILAFFFVPVRAKWLVFGYFAFQLVSSFSSGSFFSFFLLLIVLSFGYLYPVLRWEMRSPFPPLHKLESFLIHKKRALFYTFKRRGPRLHSKSQRSNDEMFIDICLDKVSKKGKKSLSLYERLRLLWIGRKRK